jgi:Spy/CpxP family protein refolding chaperone
MKEKLIALTTAFALSLGAITLVKAQDSEETGPRRNRQGEMGRRQNLLDGLPERLNLTADQKAKVQPLIDQARPQIQTIRQEAMQKTRAVIDNTMAQIRPLLTAEQQQKLDSMKTERGPRDQGDAK